MTRTEIGTLPFNSDQTLIPELVQFGPNKETYSQGGTEADMRHPDRLMTPRNLSTSIQQDSIDRTEQHFMHMPALLNSTNFPAEGTNVADLLNRFVRGVPERTGRTESALHGVDRDGQQANMTEESREVIYIFIALGVVGLRETAAVERTEQMELNEMREVMHLLSSEVREALFLELTTPTVLDKVGVSETILHTIKDVVQQENSVLNSRINNSQA